MAVAAIAIAIDSRSKGRSVADDPFLDALTALEGVLADNARRETLIKKRITRLRRTRANGLPYTESVYSEDGPSSFSCSPRTPQRSIPVARTSAGPRRKRSTTKA